MRVLISHPCWHYTRRTYCGTSTLSLIQFLEGKCLSRLQMIGDPWNCTMLSLSCLGKQRTILPLRLSSFGFLKENLPRWCPKLFCILLLRHDKSNLPVLLAVADKKCGSVAQNTRSKKCAPRSQAYGHRILSSICRITLPLAVDMMLPSCTPTLLFRIGRSLYILPHCLCLRPDFVRPAQSDIDSTLCRLVSSGNIFILSKFFKICDQSSYKVSLTVLLKLASSARVLRLLLDSYQGAIKDHEELVEKVVVSNWRPRIGKNNYATKTAIFKQLQHLHHPRRLRISRRQVVAGTLESHALHDKKRSLEVTLSRQ